MQDGCNGSEVRWSAYLASHFNISPLTSCNGFLEILFWKLMRGNRHDITDTRGSISILSALISSPHMSKTIRVHIMGYMNICILRTNAHSHARAETNMHT